MGQEHNPIFSPRELSKAERDWVDRTSPTPAPVEKLEKKIVELESKIDSLVSTINLIFNNHVLINGEFKDVQQLINGYSPQNTKRT